MSRSSMLGSTLTSCVSLLNFGRVVLRLLRREKKHFFRKFPGKIIWFLTRKVFQKKDPAPKKKPDRPNRPPSEPPQGGMAPSTGLGLDSCGLFCQDQLQLAYLTLLTPKRASKFLQNALRARRYQRPHERSTSMPLSPKHKYGLHSAHEKTRGPKGPGTRHTDATPNTSFDTCARPVCACAKKECMRAADKRGHCGGCHAAQPGLVGQEAREGDLQLLGSSHLPAHAHGQLSHLPHPCTSWAAWTEVEVRVASANLLVARIASRCSSQS